MSDTSHIPRVIVCRHCGRDIENDPEEGWIDRAAGYDDEDGDGIWRTTCDENRDTITAEHEPFPQTEDEMLVCVHGRPVWVGNECGNCEADGYKWAPDCDRHDGQWGTDRTCERCTYDNGHYRPLDDKGPLGPGGGTPVPETSLVLHTNAPLDGLSLIVAEHGRVQKSTAADGVTPDCLYGWVEPQDPEKACIPHHLVDGMSHDMLRALAEIIINTGHQVVVTTYVDWSVQPGGFPLAYDDEHQH